MKNVTVCTVRSTYLSFSVAVGIKTFGLILNLLCVQFFAWTKKSAFVTDNTDPVRVRECSRKMSTKKDERRTEGEYGRLGIVLVER